VPCLKQDPKAGDFEKRLFFLGELIIAFPVFSSVSNMSKVTFNSSKSSFFKEIKEKTDRYFADNKLLASGNRKLYIKGTIQVLSAVGLYFVLVFFTPPAIWAVLLCALLGLNLAVIGFNVMHEGGHQSFSRHRWLNTTAAYTLNMLGGNAYFWKVKHNINHHTYTNIDGLDSDIDVRPFMRLHQNQPRYWFHRFQHVYWVFLYGISYIAWVFYSDFRKYFEKSVGNPDMLKLGAKEHFVFWLTKVFYVTAYLLLPILVVGWFNTLIGFLIISFVCGLATSVVFQLAHVVESTSAPAMDVLGNIKQEWALHQINTTSNFATKSKVFFWLLGGLNFQVEHHLFPKISHVHYPEISRLVKETCKKYDIIYHEHSTMFKAFISHMVHLRRLGTS
jgi:linoleoyl-CoA desaturase